MPVGRIEQIKAGRVTKRAERNSEGVYVCFPHAQNTGPIKFTSLDDAADYLRTSPGSGIRMEPGRGKISVDVYIDGLPR